LLPFFDVGDEPIDPYGRSTFREGDLARLRKHLRLFRESIEAKPSEWSFTETVENLSKTIRLEREKVLDVIDRSLTITEIALSHAGTIVFRGD